MKDPKFLEAYDAIAPDEVTRLRILEAVRQQARQHSRSRVTRKLWLIAAAAALMGLLTIGGYAIRIWRMPEPVVYDSSTQPSADQEHALLTDEALIDQARSILELLDWTRLAEAETRVIRQDDPGTARIEVMVCYGSQEPYDTVTLDAQTGQLLQFQPTSEHSASEGEPADINTEAIARYYYERLPLEQGYVLTTADTTLKNYHYFVFSNATPEGIINPFQKCILIIRSSDGAVVSCSSSYTPLIDDRETGGTPITPEQAEEIIQTTDELILTEHEDTMGHFSQYTLHSAQAEVVQPNWNFNGKDYGGYLQAASFTRLAWVMEYQAERNGRTYVYEIYVDYYTGQILGGHAMQNK